MTGFFGQQNDHCRLMEQYGMVDVDRGRFFQHPLCHAIRAATFFWIVNSEYTPHIVLLHCEGVVVGGWCG